MIVKKNQEVRVRIAPSPTGDPHVGTAFNALFNMAFARHFGGRFLFRIEDTDQSRSRPEYEKALIEALHWCGIQWDEGPDIGGDCGPYRQSERTPIYQKYCKELLDAGKAYKCFCTSEELAEMREIQGTKGSGRQGYDRRCRNLSEDEIAAKEAAGLRFTVRLKVPLTGECVYEDAIKGRMTYPWADVDDQVLLKSDSFPTYHLANVVDDHLMRITHVIRGDEWTSSTPKHILLYQHFGWEPPTFLHMPLLLGTDGRKLSKRKNPTSIFFYRDSGYLPEAFLNFLSLMGYSMPEDREIYSLKDLFQAFDPKRIGTSGAVFDIQKLDWLNQQYIINTIPQEQLWDRLKEWSLNDTFMQKLMPIAHTRIKTFGDFFDLCNFFFINDLKYTHTLFESDRVTPHKAAEIFQVMIWHMEDHADWGPHGIETASKRAAEFFDVPHKKVIMRLLFSAIMGKHQGPPLFGSVGVLGRDRTRARLMQAMAFLGGVSNKTIKELRKQWDSASSNQAPAEEVADPSLL